ncbi:hypothetical protein SY88_01180 [Clostridiales bacterium PH28_bin88]|nr:hypothetical protein SY88_01180 [Clostridiales bacterium PH28_bin88]
MGILDRMEELSSRVVEGFFRRRFKSAIQPVEIARALARAMSRGRRVSITNVYVPNFYLIHLHPDDWQEIAPLEKAFTEELASYLQGQAEQRGLTMLGYPQVAFEVDEQMPAGTARVHTHYEGEPEEVVRRPAAGGDTMVFEAVKDGHPGGEGPLYLQVLEGPDQGSSFELTGSRMVLGRKGSSDIFLTDHRVSRRHAMVECRKGFFFITDLGSTNGTWLNGKRVERSRLQVGDGLQVGDTVMEVRER